MELPVDVIDPDAFSAAFADGDVAAIASFFRLDAVRAVVAATDTHVKAHKPRDEVFVRHSPLRPPRYFYPWYYSKPQRDDHIPANRFLLGIAVENGHFELVRWFYTCENHKCLQMDATLALILPLVVRFAMHVNNTEMLEFLLECEIFRRCFNQEQRQHALDKVLRGGWDGFNRDTMSVLVAHGARVNLDGTSAGVASGWANARQRVRLDNQLLADHGAFIAGRRQKYN